MSIERTFVHARGIGYATEQRLWLNGAQTWSTFLDQHADGLWRGARYDGLARTVEHSRSALRRRDVTFFSRRLAPADRWRLFPAFQDRVAYLDIETTGLWPTWSDVTVVALSDGERTKMFVRGKNLDRFPETISRYSVLVTFNGSQFDVPFLRAAFRRIRIPPAHIDLRFPLGQLGYSGGLKAIERELGIRRPAHLRDLDGLDAVRLWRRYEQGNGRALSTLLEYAERDVASLPMLAADACRRLAEHAGMPAVDT
jgi:uncharacterized protein YprB with RNaseH-like and TPR domain